MSASHELMSQEPAHYFPIRAGRYEIGAGLQRLGTDFGNGPSDRKIFQVDNKWPHYRHHKMCARGESLKKYFCESIRQDGVMRAVVDFLVHRLHLEHPGIFSLRTQKERGWRLHCVLSGETLCLCPEKSRLHTKVTAHRREPPDPPYVSALDALACQIQEDLAVIEIGKGEKDRVAALHLCYPNHWAAQDKIGRGFAAVHEPVPGFEKIARQSGPLLNHLLRNGPFVRFAWGLASDTRLNHHPQPAEGCSSEQDWLGRGFRPDRPQLYMRIERQVIAGLGGEGALLFLIRTYFENVAGFDSGRINQLYSAIVSMNADTLRYKGIEAHRDDILDWLASGRACAKRTR